MMPLAIEMPWRQLYCLAYSDGHNNHGLRSRRLDHYARAYADICDVRGEAVALVGFFAQWDAGDTFEGTPYEHWYYAS